MTDTQGTQESGDNMINIGGKPNPDRTNRHKSNQSNYSPNDIIGGLVNCQSTVSDSKLQSLQKWLLIQFLMTK